MNGLETKLDGIFGKKAPVQMPENGKKTLVSWMPWISLIFGLLQLLAAYWLYQWAHAASSLVDYANSICQSFGTSTDCGTASASRMTLWLYLGLAILLVDAVLLLASYPGLKARKKQGWNLVFYSALLNLVYGVLSVFVDRGGRISSLIWSLISSAIGLWLLFQIRSFYLGAKSQAPSEPKA